MRVLKGIRGNKVERMNTGAHFFGVGLLINLYFNLYEEKDLINTDVFSQKNQALRSH